MIVNKVKNVIIAEKEKRIRYKQENAKVMKFDIYDMPMFNTILIETINRCNGKCAFCPVNALEEQRPYAKMDEKLFRKIIQELSLMNFAGRVCFSCNNEPFLDDRIIDFIKYAREKLSLAFFYIWSNGSVLDKRKMQDVLPYIDKIYIDNYTDSHELNDNIKVLVAYLQETNQDFYVYDKFDIGEHKVNILIRDINEVLSSRGGQAPNKKEAKAINAKCSRPFEEIVVRPDGKVSLCCSDALGKYTLGDLNDSTLVDVWKSEEFLSVRKKLQVGRHTMELCNKCDFL